MEEIKGLYQVCTIHKLWANIFLPEKIFSGSQKDKYKVPSFQIKEGSCVNLDVTAPGATLALGLMYLGSGNKAVADWMAPPATQYLLDFVRPDFLMLRTLSRGKKTYYHKFVFF